MKPDSILIVTQKVDTGDPVLEFFHRWIAEFAKNFSLVTVICLYKGTYSLPENVHVLSLGKDEGKGKMTYILRFFKFLWHCRHDYRFVFVHMNTVYILLGGVLWHLMGKRIGLWYAHRHVNWQLRAAERLAHLVFTSTPQGFRIVSPKTHVVGQGIDTDSFVPAASIPERSELTLISVGRISPVKDQETALEAAKILKDSGFDAKLRLVGAPVIGEQDGYLQSLKQLTSTLGIQDRVEWLGAVSQEDLPALLNSADVFVSTGLTGSLDKAALEAMACGLPVITCNESVRSALGPYGETLWFEKRDPEALAACVRNLAAMDSATRHALGSAVREIVVRGHGISDLITKIKSIFLARL